MRTTLTFQGREVAVKVIIPSSTAGTHNQQAAAMDQEDIASMQIELQIMARLEHPNVVRWSSPG